MAVEMDDDEIYAYEQELREMDEWETMHAHEMEAAEEELRAMEAAEARGRRDATIDRSNADENTAATTTTTTTTVPSAATGIGSRLAETEERLRSVLERCATALGETEDDSAPLPDTELLDDYVTRKRSSRALDATTPNFLLTRPPIDVDSLSIVLPGGERRFLRKRPTHEPIVPVTATSLAVAAAKESLLPIAEMMEAIEKRQVENAMRAAVDRAPVSLSDAALPPVAPHVTRDGAGALWLDKYKPHRFIDLLSDERTNREVLAWIKQWDAFVFPHKKAAPGAAVDAFEHSSLSFPGPNKQTRADGTTGFGAHQRQRPLDPNDPRPREKIILICGPPGAGKTTLANIVARHAGYNPVEVNASDDRTTGVLRNKIISAMEMQSIWGDRKPNCIILDEIDGAMNGGDGKSAIAAIEEIVNTPLRAAKDAKTGKRSRQARHPLTRPLICICNDQYASVLRPLRKLAKIFVLDTPNSQRLVSRLKVICKHEGIRSSTGALAALCTSGANDIRYCVNAIQFQSTQCKHLSTSMVAAGPVGQKDASRGVFETMDMIFYQSKSKGTSSMPIVEQIDEAVHSMGNYSLLVNALDENLPTMIFNDPTMNKLCAAFEWMGVADSWEAKIRAEQQFAFTAYMPFAARAVHLACCTSSRRRITYPKAHAEAQKHRDRAINILEALVENAALHPSLRQSAHVLVIDVVPWLLATLSPEIRHTNPSLQTAEEKALIARLIDLMAALGLSFRPKFLPDGSEDCTLEPAIHELGVFGGRSSLLNSPPGPRTSLLPLPVRKMIMREVDLQEMRKTEGDDKTPKRKAPTASADAVGGDASMPLQQQFVLPTLTEEQEAARLETMRKRNPFAFAHREAKRKRDQALKEQAERGARQDQEAIGTGHDDDTNNHNARRKKPRHGVRYRFNEGYTCGIKTSVYMRDLL